MLTTTFHNRLTSAVQANDSLLCVGLDPDLSRFPSSVYDSQNVTNAIVSFNAGVIEATVDLICAYKPNLAFYVAHGSAGIRALEETRRLIPAHIPVILDAKVGDIGSTAEAYATGYFETWDFDAVTVNPYLGEDSLQPFMQHADKGVLVVCKTSNLGSGDLQDLSLTGGNGEQSMFLTVADRVASWTTRWPATLGLVVGATYPAELAAVRQRCPNQPILLPGIGAQAGDLAAALHTGLDATGSGLLVSASRSIIYAPPQGVEPWTSAVRSAASGLKEAINGVRASIVT